MRPRTIAAILTTTAILITVTVGATPGRRSVRPTKPSIVRPRVPRIVKPTQQSTDPLAVTSPKKYEGWGTDSKHTVKWTTTLPSTMKVKIELIQNDAAKTLFRTLTSSALNTGSYEWEGIPASQFNSVSRGLKVKISTVDNSHTAISELFTFGKPLYLHQPAAAYTWRKGSTVTITWEVVTKLPQPFRVDLMDSNHKRTLNIVSNQSPTPKASTNKRVVYKWTIPTTVDPGSYFVKVSSGDIAVEKPIKIDEPIVLPKSPHITITKPKAYVGWGTDTAHTITWNSTLPGHPHVKIDLVQIGASGIVSWRTIAADVPDTGSFTWQGIPASQYNSVSRGLRVRISTLDESQVTVGEIFTFGKPLYFLKPAAPYTWSKGSVGTITWEIVTEMPQPMKLDLLDSNRNQVLNIASNLNKIPRASTNKREVYRWTVPTNLTAGSYLIKLSSGSIAMEKPINIGN